MIAGRALIACAPAAVLLAALLLAGCGGESDTEQHREEVQVQSAVREAHLKALMKVKLAERKRREEHPGETLAPAKYSGTLAQRYEIDREICSALPASEMAASLKIDEGSDPEEIAKAYAKQYPGRYREPAYEGCLAGLE
ncbi:MAG TPA: hypothetical protein VGF09_07840 [Solirubrobacterales bacterium]